MDQLWDQLNLKDVITAYESERIVTKRYEGEEADGRIVTTAQDLKDFVTETGCSARAFMELENPADQFIKWRLAKVRYETEKTGKECMGWLKQKVTLELEKLSKGQATEKGNSVAIHQLLTTPKVRDPSAIKECRSEEEEEDNNNQSKETSGGDKGVKKCRDFYETLSIPYTQDDGDCLTLHSFSFNNKEEEPGDNKGGNVVTARMAAASGGTDNQYDGGGDCRVSTRPLSGKRRRLVSKTEPREHSYDMDDEEEDDDKREDDDNENRSLSCRRDIEGMVIEF